MSEKEKICVIAGAGPAGLSAAYELLKRSDVRPVVFEESNAIGGLSQTANFGGNRMDIGGHRFFSKSERVMRWWRDVMPEQGMPALDELLLGAASVGDGANPETDDNVMLHRRRVSRIFFLRKFFPYPISLRLSTLVNLGVVRTVNSAFGYLAAKMKPRPEHSLEDFYINRFGKPLYKLFFEDYTEKVWGKHPSQLGADWGSQRVKGLSVATLLKDAFLKPFRSADMDQKKVETSLIERFMYPKYGPGQLWERVAALVTEQGGELFMEYSVEHVIVDGGKVVAVEYRTLDGALHVRNCDYFFSSMPLNKLIPSLKGIDVPADVMRVATELPYRDFITVGLLVDRLAISNDTKLKSYLDRIPDTWIYIQERDVKVGRLQVFNNWSPYMVADYENSVFVGLEYFCNEGDELWRMPDTDFISMAVAEVERIGIINASCVLSSHIVRMKKAYPAYFGSYKELGIVRDFLDGIDGLYCIGRNGQHRYNNMDHSMLTAFAAVDCVCCGGEKSAVWNVNVEGEYHEEK